MSLKFYKPLDLHDADLHLDEEDFESLGMTVGPPYQSWHDMNEEDLPLPECFDDDTEEELEY